jgi:hypothetical protein
MNEVAEDSAEAFQDQLDVSGETLEFSRTRTPVRALVDWDLKPVEVQKAGLEFRERNYVRVEFFKSSMTPPPRVGEHYKQEDGTSFDTKAVTRTDLTYRCYCSVGEAVEENTL